MTTNMSQLFLLIFLVPVVRGFGVCETLDQLIRLSEGFLKHKETQYLLQAEAPQGLQEQHALPVELLQEG